MSQRHGPDSAAWRLICEALTLPESPRAIVTAIREGRADARVLTMALQTSTSAGQPWYPFLSGPKVSAMWIRMLVAPGGAEIEGIESVPVAVDVQVRKVSEHLGLTGTRDQPLEAVREIIQKTWADAAGEAVGPKPITGTPAAIDPAVWFFGKWGCTHCERVGRRVPISEVCGRCGMTAD